jgi:hypothetical protein
VDGVFDSERKIAVAPLGAHRHRILQNERKDDRLSGYLGEARSRPCRDQTIGTPE